MDHPSEGSPDALRSRVRDGDADAFGELFDSFASHVYNRAFRLTGDRTAAEDVLSLTFLEAWRNREQILPEGGSLRPWLLGVATNVVRGHYRARWRDQEIFARLELKLDLQDFAEDLSGRMDDVARVPAMHRSLARLRGPERDVLALGSSAKTPTRSSARGARRSRTHPASLPPTAGPDQNRHIVPRPRARHLDRGARHLRPRTQGRHAPRRDRDRGARRGELARR